jgi:hypothetical protein
VTVVVVVVVVAVVAVSAVIFGVVLKDSEEEGLKLEW